MQSKPCERCGKTFFPCKNEWPKRWAKKRFCEPCSKFSEMSDEERFWRFVILKSKGKWDGCWDWLGWKDKKGYGHFNLSPKKPILAHRMSWTLFNGAIPEGMWVLHKCDNPPCTNPFHLYLGTIKENTRDAVERGRTARGERHARAKLTETQVRTIRAEFTAGATQKSLCEKYSIGAPNISMIVNGQIWRHAL